MYMSSIDELPYRGATEVGTRPDGLRVRMITGAYEQRDPASNHHHDRAAFCTSRSGSEDCLYAHLLWVILLLGRCGQ